MAIHNYSKYGIDILYLKAQNSIVNNHCFHPSIPVGGAVLQTIGQSGKFPNVLLRQLFITNKQTLETPMWEIHQFLFSNNIAKDTFISR